MMKTCALCEKQVETLIDSHLMPNAVYRAMRRLGPDEKLLQLNFGDGTVYYHDKQIKTRLLCSECESLFSRRGEQPLGMIWATSKHFGLLDTLKNSPGGQPLDRGMMLYDGIILPAEITEPLQFFTLSLFWRASVWPERLSNRYNGALGPYAQKIKSFLLGGASDLEFKLLFQVNTNPAFHSLMSLPALVCRNGVKAHCVSMQGLSVQLYLGRSTRSPDNQCIFRNMQSNLAFVSLDISQTPIISRMVERLPSVRLAGKLREE